MWGSNIVLTNGGGTVNLSNLPGEPNEFFITGTPTLAASWTIQLNPALTAIKGNAFIFHYTAEAVLVADDITIFGTALNKEQAAKESLILAIYDGAAWQVKILMDSSDLASQVGGTETRPITAVGGTITLDTKKDNAYQIITGSAILAGSWVITAGGTPVDGDEFWINYQATMTLGVNDITIFGTALSAEQALSGNVIVYAKYDGAAWSAIIINGSGTGQMWEAGSAGTESCTRINSTTGCDATGDYATACGHDTLASGNNSFGTGETNVVSGDDGVVSGGYNTVSGNGSASHGSGNTVSGICSWASGNNVEVSGNYATGSGIDCVVSGAGASARGAGHTASGDYTSCEGIQAVAHIDGSHAKGYGMFGVVGDNQNIIVPLKISTTDATPTNLRLTVNATEGVTIPTDCTANVYIRIAAVQTGGAAGTIGDSFMQNIKLCVKNIAGVSSVVTMNAATLANYSTVAGNVLYELSACDVAFGGTVAVSVAANKIQIEVTGEVSKNIRWSAEVSMCWIGYRNFTI